jgi:hypothetical protein
MKNRSPILTAILLALFCVALLPKAQAVVPAPDGGYPGGNTAEGQSALLSLTTGGFNTAVGYLALRNNTVGSLNTALGAGALLANTQGTDGNTAIGAGTLLSNVVGAYNTATGTDALVSNTTGSVNSAFGVQALYANTLGAVNTATGYHALFHNISGSYNTAVGDFALTQNTIGDDNTAIGDNSLRENTTGAHNTALGDSAGQNVTTANHVICIGASGDDVSNTTWIGNVYGVTTSRPITLPVVVSDSHQLGTMSSSRRFKKEIKPMGSASEAILALKPITFEYKSDKTSTPQFGLIAEDVAAVNPDLVVCDKNGEIYTVRYDAVNVMLLNEFLKEHAKVEEQICEIQEHKATIAQVRSNAAKQEATITQLKSTIAQEQKGFQSKLAEQEKQIEALASALQRVSARVEVRKPAPRVVVNEP